MKLLASDKTYRNMVRRVLAVSFFGDIGIQNIPDTEIIKNVKENIKKILPSMDESKLNYFFKYLSSKDVFDNDLLSSLSLLGIDAKDIKQIPGQKATMILRQQFRNFLEVARRQPQVIKELEIEPIKESPVKDIVKKIKEKILVRKVAMDFLDKLEG
jgi:hypothetical protein